MQNNEQCNSQKENPTSHTFVITVKSCKNETWQGTVNWVEKKEIQAFRSALELIRLMDSALEPEQEDL